MLDLGCDSSITWSRARLLKKMPTRWAATRSTEIDMDDYPPMIAQIDQIAAVPRRVRAILAGKVVLDTTRAVYVWEWANYPHYYIPIADVNADFLVNEQRSHRMSRGVAAMHGLRVGPVERPSCARLFLDDSLEGLSGTLRFDWEALDAWYEEDEEVFVHPRNPYVRVDALRSTRSIRIEMERSVIAESLSPVMVFETGLPTRYYLNSTEVNFDYLVPTSSVSSCPYKGMTSRYWSIRVGDAVHEDLVWTYDFPTPQLQAIAGLLAFYNERVDIFLDGQPLPRPKTHFFK